MTASQDSNVSAEGGGTARSAPFAAIERRLGRTGVVAFLTVTLGLLAILWMNVLAPLSPISTIPCPFESLTGYDCPGCGLQSSVVNLFHLRWKYVLMANLLSPVLLPLFYVMVVSWGAEYFFGLRIWRFRVPRSVVVAGIVVVILYSVARNIPALGVW